MSRLIIRQMTVSPALARTALLVLLSTALFACSGDSPTPSQPDPPTPPTPPSTPTISAPTRLMAGEVGTASIGSRPSSTYAWTITGGEILTGAGSTQITFRSTTAGPIHLTATVANEAGQVSDPGEATVTSFTTLTRILSSNVTGSPTAGTTEYDSPDSVAFSYSPTAGAANVTVEVDGVAGAGSGAVTMDQHRTLWVYGNPGTGPTFPEMIVVPTDPTVIPDLAFYAERPAATTRVADPYCGVVSPTVAYPKSYLGEFPMPQLGGASLAAATQRGVSLKDYWAYINNNPTTNDGCSSSWHAALEETLRRVKALGSDYVAIYQNAYLEDVNAVPLKFDCMGQGCPSWAQIPDSEVLRTAERARAHGLDLYLYVQVDVHDLEGGMLPTAPTAEWLDRYFAAYTEYMRHLGSLAEQAGIPLMQVDWGVWWIDWTEPQYKPIYQARLAEVAAEVRKVYSGKLALGVLSPWASDHDALMAQIDVLLLELWGVRFWMNEQHSANPTAAVVRDRTEAMLRDLAGVLGKYGKPTIFRIMAQSQSEFLRTGWIEDGFCSPGCPQRNVKIDFSVQAITYQGQLEAVQNQTAFPTAAVDAMGYWFADVMLPKESFPNLSQSIRNKPAEVIVHRWFRR
jgi:hypothetical protein